MFKYEIVITLPPEKTEEQLAKSKKALLHASEARKLQLSDAGA